MDTDAISREPTNSVKPCWSRPDLRTRKGIYTTQFTKQAGDPAWADDPR